MPFLQDMIHKLEVGGGMRYFRGVLVFLVLLALMGGYDWRAFKNMSSQEAMDSAQLARNISEGKGYTTLFVRPFSIHLLKKHNLKHGRATDPGLLKEMHPDLANPPVYPTVLAGLMKLKIFGYAIPTTSKPFWSNNGRFWRYKPDFTIAVFNQVLFILAVFVVFLLARKLFDQRVAWLSGIVLLGTEMFWRFSVSGLSTMLLLLIFLWLVWAVVELEEEIRAPRRGFRGLLFWSVLAGAAVGVGCLTRYSFGWLILPLLVFLIVFGGPHRVVLAMIVLLTFCGVLAPWLVRNYTLCGNPFGTAAYAVLEGTVLFPEFRLQRSLEPDFSRIGLMPFWVKLMVNSRQIFQNELPKLGGSWVTALFLVGLLVGFRKPSVKRLRYFILINLLVLAIAQALGRTHLSEDSPEINSENLLILIVPIAIVYGISLFFLLLDQMTLPAHEMRYVVLGLLGFVAWLPMIFAFLPPRTIPVAYPPYYPPAIQNIAGWLKEKELAMSDIPWAMAWYGQRQCIWLTLKATPDAKDPSSREDLFAINDYQKPISALYLTPQTMDSRFVSQWIRAGEQSWGSFILQCIVNKEVPPQFPLNKMPAGWLPEQMVLTDWERWRRSSGE